MGSRNINIYLNNSAHTPMPWPFVLKYQAMNIKDLMKSFALFPVGKIYGVGCNQEINHF